MKMHIISPQATLPFFTARFRSKSAPVSISLSPIYLSSSFTLLLSSPSTAASAPPHLRRLRLFAAPETRQTKTFEETEARYEKNKKVVVKSIGSPRLVLKFIWMDKKLGLGIDQMIPGHGCVPLSPFYFWPKKDAWEELKAKLEEKPWISEKQRVIILNHATDVINLWQQVGN